ncbi:Transporter, auxin efflux carrier family protein [Alteracholeplasma palmae J233]|uniref:Transporter, auxin efflux carrier family protein n=1 Tax=Alteracholeplasma palmae (strain ATCC 49389 / J233) TaxID=1318466 RepID=U4KR84_ALTPJ|nr:AEC family transporter [Alteracholeplasma palmae]CCV63936.1 Transporter, auxin efflux carrier family protein [Alteracholeplasma palmae J233]
MLESIIFTINQILPLLLVIGLGQLIFKLKIIDDNFIKQSNKYIFKAGLPIYLFFEIFNIASFNDINWWFIIYALGALIVIYLVGMIVVILTIKDRKQKAVVLQAAFRPNFGIIGVPLAKELGSLQASAHAAVLAAFLIPISNILSILSLSYYAPKDANNQSIKKVLLNIIKNPVIIGVLTGLVVLLLKPYLTFLQIDSTAPFLYKGIKMIASITTPFALLILGAGFRFKTNKVEGKSIVITVLLRNLISPVLILGITVLLHHYNILTFGEIGYPALIALSCAPSAVSTVSLAAQMKQDERLAGNIVVWTSIISIFVIVTVTMIFKYSGLI